MVYPHKLVILGQPFSKANSRKLVLFGNRPASIKSDKARAYATSALEQLILQTRGMKTHIVPLVVEMKIYYPDRRQDLDPSLVLDVMQRQKDSKSGIVLWDGVYVNDRQIEEMHLYRYIDKSNPRCEIKVQPLANWP